VSPRESAQRRKMELEARNVRKFCLNADFHVTFIDLLHAVKLRHGTDGFTSPPKESVLRIFFGLKIQRLRPGANPRTWVPKASTLPLDHRSRLPATIRETSSEKSPWWACLRGSTEISSRTCLLCRCCTKVLGVVHNSKKTVCSDFSVTVGMRCSVLGVLIQIDIFILCCTEPLGVAHSREEAVCTEQSVTSKSGLLCAM